MKVNVVDLSSTEKKLEVTIPAEKVKEKHDLIFDQFKTSAKIKGFRPGKAPKRMIISMYGSSINEEIVSKIVSETFENAVSEASVSPVSKPDITPGDVDPKNEFIYSAVFEVLPEFEIKNYEGLNIKKSVLEIKEQEINDTLERLRESQATSKLIKRKRAAKEGDFVFVDYKGTVEDGTTIDDLNKENVRFLVGKGQLIPEFEDNIIGNKTGHEANFSVEYPEDFNIKEAAGKTVNFILKINEIHDRIVPKLNNEFAKDLEFKNMAELTNKIREDIENRNKETTNASLREQVLDILVKENDIDVPKSLVQSEEVALRRQFASSFLSRGMELPKMGEEALAKFTEKAVESVKGSIILNRIAVKNEIKVTKEDIDERFQQIATSYQLPVKTIKESYEKNNMMGEIESAIIEKKVLDLIIEKANIEEVLEEEAKIDGEDNS